MCSSDLPRRIFVCPPDASQEVQDNVFKGNMKHISECDFTLVNTTYRDIGTIWEAGAAAMQQMRPPS